MSVKYRTVSALSMNPWEYNALEYNFPEDPTTSMPLQDDIDDIVNDSIIFPGIYAPSGFDILSILVSCHDFSYVTPLFSQSLKNVLIAATEKKTRVAMRPSPVVELGAVDASCAIVVCDIELPDCPVVYANEACAQLTGYPLGEMMGKNCRFMQAPGGQVSQSSARSHVEKSTVKKMRSAVHSNSELSVEVTNFKKNGQKFTNILTMIPICWNTPTPKYFIGFLAEKMA
ncbi:vivid PAS protein VVD [Xylaria longipes]|nr:vivid PAS protein VVD [Xylaria longipes]